jgi:hypothetical protein
VSPDAPLDDSIVQQEYDKLWNKLDHEALETNSDEDRINRGIPSRAMAEAAKTSMRWENLVQMGACTATYACDKYILQLTNSTIIAVLLSGFSTASVVQGLDLKEETRFSQTYYLIFQGLLYSFFMLLSAFYCFGATGIALHSVNRLSNVCPSKASIAYMTKEIFHCARDAIETYVYRGIAFACAGIVVAVTWNTIDI